jgi:hypothetical protein
VALPHYLLNCPAWKTLPSDGKALLIDVWKRHNGSNNGEISYSVREAEEIGISRSAAARMFKELVERGFLAVARNSAFNLKTREARRWRLAAEPCHGVTATRDFMRWRPLQGADKKSNHSPSRETHSPSLGTDELAAQ